MPGPSIIRDYPNPGWRGRATSHAGDAGDDALDFAGLGVALTFNDLPHEDDVFEINDCETVVFELLSRVG